MFEELLSKIAAGLRKHNLAYMIIEGQAVLLYGEPRLTRDIDITLGVGADRLDDLLALINEISLKPVPQDIVAFVRQTMVLPAIDEATGIRVDFIFSFSPYETNAIQRGRKIAILGQEVCFASPEDVVIHKIFAGRPRDIEDARIILLKNPEIDYSYIRKWLSEFDLTLDEERDLLKTFEDLVKA